MKKLFLSIFLLNVCSPEVQAQESCPTSSVQTCENNYNCAESTNPSCCNQWVGYSCAAYYGCYATPPRCGSQQNGWGPSSSIVTPRSKGSLSKEKALN